MNFEDQLRMALVRKEPSSAFAGRVMAATSRVNRGAGNKRGFWKPWAVGCLAASLLAGVFAIKQPEGRRHREKGEVARAQLLQALQITSNKLHHIQQKVESMN